jgi:hypothetical protein
MLLIGRASSFCTIETLKKIKFQPFTRLIRSRTFLDDFLDKVPDQSKNFIPIPSFPFEKHTGVHFRQVNKHQFVVCLSKINSRN